MGRRTAKIIGGSLAGLALSGLALVGWRFWQASRALREPRWAIDEQKVVPIKEVLGKETFLSALADEGWLDHLTTPPGVNGDGTPENRFNTRFETADGHTVTIKGDDKRFYIARVEVRGTPLQLPTAALADDISYRRFAELVPIPAV